MAAQQLDPPPRDFTRDTGLTRPRILEVLDRGKPGTAMASFAATLPPEEREAVADFVLDEFVRRGAPNTRYHTAENGWPEHDRKYGVAFPFVRGEISLDEPVDRLGPGARQGRTLFVEACLTCHDQRSRTPLWESFPLSHVGQVVRDPADIISRPSVYAVHDRPLTIAGLAEQEADGKRLYDANCAFCHAIDGTGKNWIGAFLQPHPRNLTERDQVGHLDPERLRQVIREGLPDTSMPAWGAVLNDAEIAAVAAYVRRAFIGPALGEISPAASP